MAAATRQRLVETAEKLFYTDGFRNVGLDQILAEVGITKTAFYKHFSGKEELMLEVLEKHHRIMQRQFMDLLRKRAGLGARDQLRAVFDVVEEIIQSTDFKGCIFVNAAIEFPLPSDPVYQAAARTKREVEQTIHDVAERAGADEPHCLAQELCMIMEGAYVTRHVTGNPDTIGIARRLAQHAIDARLSPPARNRSAARRANAG